MTYQPKIYRKQGGNELVISSGGKITVETGGYVAGYTETISTSADLLTAAGLSVVTGTTAGPTFLIADPITGVAKYIALAATSSGITHRAIIAAASTAVTFDTTGANLLTLTTSGIRGITLYGASTTAWRTVGCYVNTMLGLST